jgi:hypothetical protein
LREAEGGNAGLAVAALGGGVLAAASTVTGAVILGTTAPRITDIGPAGARPWWTMFQMSFGAALIGLLLLIGATAVVTLESQLLPRWFAVACALLALVSIVGAFTIGYATTGIQATAGIAVILDSVWIFAPARDGRRRRPLAAQMLGRVANRDRNIAARTVRDLRVDPQAEPAESGRADRERPLSPRERRPPPLPLM